METFTKLIGWLSAGLLILTISRQVLKQYRTRSTAGVSHWLFIGQCASSVGFVLYSFLVEDMVFVVANCFILLTAVAGQLIYMRNRRMEQSAEQSPEQKPRQNTNLQSN